MRTIVLANVRFDLDKVVTRPLFCLSTQSPRTNDLDVCANPEVHCRASVLRFGIARYYCATNAGGIHALAAFRVSECKHLS